MQSANILLVDDEPGMLRYLKTVLEADSHRVDTADSGPQALELLQREPVPDLVVLDLVMPGMDGMQTLARLRKFRPEVKVVMLTCVSDPRKAVEAVRLGAQDYLTKPFEKSELDAVIAQCLAASAARTESEDAGAPPDAAIEELADDRFFWASCPAMRKIREQVGTVARVDVPVLLLGESGTGKEIVARLIHQLSPRAHRTFLKVNCAALPSELLESELFGYEQGAFTGANRSKPGKFELCRQGTILLDEIGEMPPSLQTKLLHVLQDHQFSRLGSRSNVHVDVRILAATNVHMQQAIASGAMREDLYYRLNAFTMHLPPLRERRSEIPFLLRQFLARLASRYARPPLPVSQAMMDACMRYHWPGNLRDLENFAKRYVIFGDQDLVLSELEEKIAEGTAAKGASPAPAAPGDLKQLVRGVKGEAEMEAIVRALQHSRGVRKDAARILNISYKALLYKMRQYGLD